MSTTNVVFGSPNEEKRFKHLRRHHASSKRLSRLHWGIRHKHPHRLAALTRSLLNEQLDWRVKRDPDQMRAIHVDCIKHLIRRSVPALRILNKLSKIKSRDNVSELQSLWDKAQSVLQQFKEDNKANEDAAAADERGGEGSDSDAMDAAESLLEQEQEQSHPSSELEK